MWRASVISSTAMLNFRAKRPLPTMSRWLQKTYSVWSSRSVTITSITESPTATNRPTADSLCQKK